MQPHLYMLQWIKSARYLGSNFRSQNDLRTCLCVNHRSIFSKTVILCIADTLDAPHDKLHIHFLSDDIVVKTYKKENVIENNCSLWKESQCCFSMGYLFL